MVTFIKEYTVGQIIADTFRIYGRHLVPLFLICLVPMVPFDVLTAIGAATHHGMLAAIAFVLTLAAGAFVYGALTIAVSDICLGNPPSFKRSYSAIGRIFGKYLGTYIAVALLFLIGLVLVFIPGLVALVLLMFALPVATLERKGVIASIKRSIALNKGYFWRNTGVAVSVTLVAVLCMLAVIAAIGITAEALDAAAPDSFFFNFTMSIASTFVTPLLQIPLVLLYYDMRVRKEYFDGSALAQEMFA